MAGTLALTKAELTRLMHNKRYFIFTVGFPVILYLLIGRQVSTTGLRHRVRGLLHDRDGHVRRLQRRAERQRAADLAGEEGRLDPPAQAHPAAGQRLRGHQDPRLAGHHGAGHRHRAAARPLLRQRPPARLAVAGHRGHHLVRLDRSSPRWPWPSATGSRRTRSSRSPSSCTSSSPSSAACGSRCPGSSAKIGKFTPTYEAVKIGTDVIQGGSIPAGLAVGLVAWLGIFAALATVAVRSTAESV